MVILSDPPPPLRAPLTRRLRLLPRLLLSTSSSSSSCSYRALPSRRRLLLLLLARLIFLFFSSSSSSSSSRYSRTVLQRKTSSLRLPPLRRVAPARSRVHWRQTSAPAQKIRDKLIDTRRAFYTPTILVECKTSLKAGARKREAPLLLRLDQEEEEGPCSRIRSGRTFAVESRLLLLLLLLLIASVLIRGHRAALSASSSSARGGRVCD